MAQGPVASLAQDFGSHYRVGKHAIAQMASLVTGRCHTMFLKTDGSAWGVGSNDAGQLGDGTTDKRLRPVQVMTDVASISAGEAHTMFLKTDGSAYRYWYHIYR